MCWSAGGTFPTSQVALNASSIPTGTLGFIATATVTFCTSSVSAVYVSGDTTLTGPLSVDDMLLYKLDANPVIGLGFFATTCSTSGFLSISSSSVAQVSSNGNAPAFSLGTLGAGTHTLQIGTYNCGGAGLNGPINLVGCSLTPCAPTVWSGTYQVTSACNTASCCCISGTFAAVQVGTQVSATPSVTGNCGGATSISLVLNLATATSTSGSTTVGGQTINIAKSGSTVTLTNTANAVCSGTARCTSGDCTIGPVSTACFHESTRISYRGQDFGLDQLRQHRECRIPHVVRARGVVIETSCSDRRGGISVGANIEAKTLRLTNDHLVFTASGLRQASALSAGDEVFADLAQEHTCRVTRVTTEPQEESYFGLNCVESEVLANGIKTSTFGTYHSIPAFWMAYASRLLGVERASRWGDTVVNVLFKN